MMVNLYFSKTFLLNKFDLCSFLIHMHSFSSTPTCLQVVILVQYLRDYQTFVGTARYWTEAFAKTSSLGVEEKVCDLLD